MYTHFVVVEFLLWTIGMHAHALNLTSLCSVAPYWGSTLSIGSGDKQGRLELPFVRWSVAWRCAWEMFVAGFGQVCQGRDYNCTQLRRVFLHFFIAIWWYYGELQPSWSLTSRKFSHVSATHCKLLFLSWLRLTLFIKMDPSKVKLVVFGIDKPVHFIVAFLLPQDNRLFLFDSTWREQDLSPNEDEVINNLLSKLCCYILCRSKPCYGSGDKFVASTVMLRRMKSP